MTKKILIGSLLLILGNAWATITATVDRNQVAVGQSFTLTINLPDSGDNPNLDILKKNFDMFGTSTSSQTSIINGKISSQNTFSVNLIPKVAGKLMIPPIKVGNDLTNPINIEVSGQDSAVNAKALKNNSLYLDASIPKQNIYSGVPFVYTVKLYFNTSLSNVSMQPINIDGAQIQPQGKSSQYQSNENGVMYNVLEQKFLITPSRSGNLSIPAAKIQGTVADNNPNNLFAVMGAGKPFMINSKPITVSVKSIPNNVPANEWLPAKELKLNDSWSTNDTSIKVGDPVTHSISLEALGVPATSIPELQFTTPDGVNAYPDKSQSSTNDKNGDIVSNKTFKIAYIPTKAGNLTFPEVKIKWWDLTSDSLKTVVVPARTFDVIVDSNAALNSANIASGVTAGDKTQISSNSTNNLAIKDDDSIWRYLTFIFAGLWIITLFIALGLYRSKGKLSQSSNNVEQDTSLSQFKPNNFDVSHSIKESCQRGDIHGLNQSLIDWAKSYTKQNIYTAHDIKTIIQNDELNLLIDDLTAAIYNGKSFDKFHLVEELISKIQQKTTTMAKNKKSLKELYPE